MSARAIDHAAVRGAERDDLMLEYVRTHGSATVETLSEEFGIGPSSVRRVLQRLSRDGRLVRTYGGATIVDRARGSERTSAPTRRSRPTTTTGRILPDGQGIATISGSTAAEFAQHLADRVYESLRARILRGELRSGERLSIADIARSLGISVAPVQDAVHRLAAEGLVAVSARLGTVVAPVSEMDVRELYQLRLILEPSAAEIAAGTLSEAELGELTDLVERLEASGRMASIELDDFIRERELDGEFHAGIIRGVRNERLNAFYATIRSTVIVVRAMFPLMYPDTEEAIGGHRRILETLIRRDGPAARREVEEHLRSAEYETIRHMAASR